MKLTAGFGGAVALGAVLFFAGCGGGTASTPSPDATATEHEHAHAEHGPHGGELVELGADEYHAEIVKETSGMLGVYILDSSAKNLVPIAEAEIRLNIVHRGSPDQHVLAAVPAEGDPAGTSSHFVSKDGHAGVGLRQSGAEAKLVVMIDGTSYRGTIAQNHGHEHAAHDHDGREHAH